MLSAELFEGGVVRFLMARRLLGRDLYPAACYLVDGVLVDSGIHHLRRALAAALAGRPLTALVNTHAHEDHMGANAPLQRERGVPVLAHPDALPVLADPRLLSLRPYQRIFFGEPAPSAGRAIGNAVETERHLFRVMHAPGHSADHLVLYEPRRGWLFSGDAFIAGADRVFRRSYDLGRMTETLRMLAALDAEVMFTGMGQVVRRPARQIERKLDYLGEIAERIAALGRQGAAPAEIARRLFPGDFAVRVVTSGDFAAEHLVRSVLRHRAPRPSPPPPGGPPR